MEKLWSLGMYGPHTGFHWLAKLHCFSVENVRKISMLLV